MTCTVCMMCCEGCRDGSTQIGLVGAPQTGHTDPIPAQNDDIYQTLEAWRLVDCRWIYRYRYLKQSLEGMGRNQREGGFDSSPFPQEKVHEFFPRRLLRSGTITKKVFIHLFVSYFALVQLCRGWSACNCR